MAVGLAVSLLVLSSGSPAPPPGGPWRLVWADEFDGPSLNTSRWTVKHNGTHGGLEQQLYLLH